MGVRKPMLRLDSGEERQHRRLSMDGRWSVSTGSDSVSDFGLFQDRCHAAEDAALGAKESRGKQEWNSY